MNKNTNRPVEIILYTTYDWKSVKYSKCKYIKGAIRDINSQLGVCIACTPKQICPQRYLAQQALNLHWAKKDITDITWPWPVQLVKMEQENYTHRGRRETPLSTLDFMTPQALYIANFFFQMSNKLNIAYRSFNLISELRTDSKYRNWWNQSQRGNV